VEYWWIVPGAVLFLIGIAGTVLHFALSLARRPNLRIGLRALWLRQVGIGLFFVGLGVGRFVLPGIAAGPDIGQIIIGALIAGIGGLYFISTTDSFFRTGRLETPPHWEHRPSEPVADEKPTKGASS
jgi:hypothetical protein